MEEPAGALDTMEKLVFSYTPVASGQSCTKEGSNRTVRTAPTSTKTTPSACQPSTSVAAVDLKMTT
jgi:hypothetical protein